MNKYTLFLHNPKLEEQYQQTYFQNHYLYLRNIGIGVIIASLVSICMYVIDGVTLWKPYFYFFCYILAYLTMLIVANFKKATLNYSQIIYIVLVTSLMAWSARDAELGNAIHGTIDPFIRGFMLSVGVLMLYEGNNFVLQFIACTYMFFLFIGIYIRSQPQVALKLLPFYIMYSYRLWKTEYAKRTQFLQQVKESTWNHIIENVLPISLVVTKYKPREEQVELHSHNKQSDVQFQINSNDNLELFTKNTQLVKIDPGQDTDETTAANIRSLMELLNQSHYQQSVPSKLINEKQYWANSLHGFLKIQFIAYCNSNAKTKKNMQPHQQHLDQGKSPQLRLNSNQGERGLQQEDSSKKATPVNNRNKSTSMQRKLRANKMQNDYFEYIGLFSKSDSNKSSTHEQLLVRIAFFTLEQPYCVISIQNESYRNKFIKKQIQNLFYQSFLKESITKSLNNNLRNFSVMKELMQNQAFTKIVKEQELCAQIDQLLQNTYLARVDSLNRLEFLDKIGQRAKRPNQIAEFSIRSEVSSFLRMLRHQILMKKINVFLRFQMPENAIKTNKQKFTLIVVNLLNNAVEHTPHGGRLVVQVRQSRNKYLKFIIQNQIDPVDMRSEIDLNLKFSDDQLNYEQSMKGQVSLGCKISNQLIKEIGPFDTFYFRKIFDKTFEVKFYIYQNLDIINQDCSQFRKASDCMRGLSMTGNEKDEIAAHEEGHYTDHSDSDESLELWVNLQDLQLQKSHFRFCSISDKNQCISESPTNQNFSIQQEKRPSYQDYSGISKSIQGLGQGGGYSQILLSSFHNQSSTSHIQLEERKQKSSIQLSVLPLNQTQLADNQTPLPEEAQTRVSFVIK